VSDAAIDLGGSNIRLNEVVSRNLPGGIEKMYNILSQDCWCPGPNVSLERFVETNTNRIS
jgi:hypothetical protein